MSTIRYLTGVSNSLVEAVAFERNIGLLVQPGNGYHEKVGRYPVWAGDNGAFTKAAGGFSPERFRRMLSRPELRAAADRCLFVVAPDKLVVLPDGTVVGDARGTLEQFPAWAEEIRAAGFPVAFVAQNGLENMLDEVPWHLVDVLFLGGSTEWKLGDGARACVDRARAEGKRTHMGRVNSGKRLAFANSWGVDTADGTFLAFGPTKNLPRLLAWLDGVDRTACETACKVWGVVGAREMFKQLRGSAARLATLAAAMAGSGLDAEAAALRGHVAGMTGELAA